MREGYLLTFQKIKTQVNLNSISRLLENLCFFNFVERYQVTLSHKLHQYQQIDLKFWHYVTEYDFIGLALYP